MPVNASIIRQQFIDFFVQRAGHTFAPSSPVVPHDDPTLLFTNAGMNQFKDVFLGQGNRPYTRAVNSQKCIRAGGKHNDLEDVGKDTYHHTFFEMLGNWSFGDYFKAEAIQWAWELLTEVWKIDKTRLHATYFQGDAAENLEPDFEARDLWLKYLPADRVHPGNKKDNFWEMGDTGPCGPCSEIHYDGTRDSSGGTLVNAGDPRVIEIWNLVFIQFNRGPGAGGDGQPGKLTPLPAKHVDTGMGFERITRVIQGKDSNYDTDIWSPIFHAIETQTGARPYRGKLDDHIDIAYRVIADHIRCLTVAITDGAQPSNDGRGYVLRRILRRAVRHAHQTLNVKGPLLNRLVPSVALSLGDAFPELKKNPQRVADIIRDEEEAFLKTLDRGLQLFEEAAARAGSPALRAGSAFAYERQLLKSLGDDVDLAFALEINAPDFVARNPFPKGEPSPAELESSRRLLPHIRLPEATYFVTWRCLPDQVLSPKERDVVLSALTHWDNERCRVFGAVVMPDHVHWIVKPFESGSLDDLVAGVKRFSAREINSLRGSAGSLWSAESFDHIVRDIRWLSKFLFYICRNPAKALLVAKPSEYKWLFVHPTVRTLDNSEILRAVDTPGSESRGTKTISAEDAFKLHDTYGFPIDLTRVMAEERGISVDEAGFNRLMEQARQQSRGTRESTSGEGDLALTPDAIARLKHMRVAPTVDVDKYHGRPITARVEAIWNGAGFDEYVDNSGAAGNGLLAIITDRTNFYAEAGGQIADTGRIGDFDGDASEFEVQDVKAFGPPGEGYVLHIGRLARGHIRVGETAHLKVPGERRDAVRANHSATHLLNWALREVLGDNVHQKGSLVADDRLRFDFSHSHALTPEQIECVESLVNERIAQDLQVFADIVPLATARQINSLRAVFGERYPDPVRVVSIGVSVPELIASPSNPKWRQFSIELCGGTHLAHTQEARLFVLVSEQALAAGVRRIIALTGGAAMAADKAGNELEHRAANAARLADDLIAHEFDEIVRAAEELTLAAMQRQRIAHLIDALRPRIKALRKSAQSATRDVVVDQARRIAERDRGSRIIVDVIKQADKDSLLAALDVIKAKLPEAAAMLISADETEDKVLIAAAVPKPLIESGLKAGDWVKQAATICGGGGGGRPDMAQAGGKDPSKIPDAMRQSREFAEQKLSAATRPV